MSSRRKKAPKTLLADDTSSTVRHAPSKLIPEWMHRERTRILTTSTESPNKTTKKSCVLYWMQRDARTSDNWALLFASHLARKLSVPLRVAYLPPAPESLPQTWTERYVSFLLEGLQCVEAELTEAGIPFDVVMPASKDVVEKEAVTSALLHRDQPCVVVCDHSPLRHLRRAKTLAAEGLDECGIPLYEVDAHNVIPVWYVSDKREVGARTLRKKIDNLLGEYMTHFPTLDVDSSINNKEYLQKGRSKIDWEEVAKYLQPDTNVKPVKGFKGGTKAGMKQFKFFLSNGLSKYDKLRNDPNYPINVSSLSPWINFGHISFQRLALTVRQDNKHPNGTAAFIEEGVVRRELSDNYCFYTDGYDSIEGGAAGWAKESLELHTADEREWIFTLEELENAKTHDDLWNASQLQLNKEGKLHGFLRMYWAKKILEWTPSPATALQYAQYLNDKYALDGNDPNGYVGVGWSIMGVHDMGWKERPIFGKIRYMNYAGCKRKFKVDDFVKKYPPAKKNAEEVLKRKSKDNVAATVGSSKKRKR